MVSSLFQRFSFANKINFYKITSCTIGKVYKSTETPNDQTQSSDHDHLPPHLREFVTDLKESRSKKLAADYEHWEKWELIKRIKELEKHTQNQHNIIKKYNRDEISESQDDIKLNDKLKNSTFRHIAIKVLYLGFDYQGLIFDPNIVSKAILSEIGKALTKGLLIKSWKDANIKQCGRTDKEVSAFSQVLTLKIRSNQYEGKGLYEPENDDDAERNNQERLKSIEPKPEINYPYRLNKLLPLEIKVLAWAPVDLEFNPRYNCKTRTYKYYFLKWNLNIQAMQDAVSRMVGVHDFRNFCKHNLSAGVVDFKREVYSANLSSVDNSLDLMVLTIQGSSFLWHQIRYMVSVMFLVGQGSEEPQIVSQLLDVENCPRRPMYNPEKAYPLVLFDCTFNDDLEWNYKEENLMHIFKNYYQLWKKTYMKAAVIGDMVNSLGQLLPSQPSNINPDLPGDEKPYKPLLQRVMMRSFDEMIEDRRKNIETLKLLGKE